MRKLRKKQTHTKDNQLRYKQGKPKASDQQRKRKVLASLHGSVCIPDSYLGDRRVKTVYLYLKVFSRLKGL